MDGEELREDEIKRIAWSFIINGFYYATEQSKITCEKNNWDEEEFSKEVMWYYEDLLNM